MCTQMRMVVKITGRWQCLTESKWRQQNNALQLHDDMHLSGVFVWKNDHRNGIE